MAPNENLENMDVSIQKMNQMIHAIQVGCDNCNTPHLMRDCALDGYGNKKVQVRYSSGEKYDMGQR